MGCAGSSEDKAKKPPTPENTLKILCLGIGGCGKTTFVKQMKIIHNVGWSEPELAGFRKIIKSNIITGLQSAIDVAAHLGKDIKEENIEAFKALKAVPVRSADFSDASLQENIRKLSSDPAVLDVCRNHPEKLDQTHLIYFLEKFETLLTDDFAVSDEDILRSRQRTAGANSTLVYFNKKYFEFYDIGGQKPERPKWQLVLSDHEFAAILYFVATDEFDVPDEENEFKDSKLELSKLIFSELINDGTIQESKVPVVLMLNRSDLFKKRWDETESVASFKEAHAEFKGETAVDALMYMEKKFLAEQKDKDRNEVSSKQSCALDTDTMKDMWKVIRDSVLMRRLDDLIL